MTAAPIGIFDSGFGGLTVMKAICQLLPHENIVYFGDTGRLPYGTKSQETILRFSFENSYFLVSKGIKLLVVACHTASSFALQQLQEQLPIPVIGVTTPSIEHVAAHSPFGRIGVLGTRGTIASGVYQKNLSQLLPSAEITSIPCQLLVHLVEEGYINHPITEAALQEYLKPLQSKMIDTLLLGCTHFPLLIEQIQKIVGPSVNVIDPAKFCAQSVKNQLSEKNLLSLEQTPPTYDFFVSDDPAKFRLLGETFLGQPLALVRIS